MPTPLPRPSRIPTIITHTGTEPPYGYMDWWPTSMWFNHEEGPFTEKDVRWAVSYSIDRQQLLDVGLDGSGILTPLPFPQYPGHAALLRCCRRSVGEVSDQ